MRNLLLSVTLFAFSAATAFADSDWKHLRFDIGSDSLAVDYKVHDATPLQSPGCYKCSIDDTAGPLFFNFAGEQLSSDSKVRVVIKSTKIRESSGEIFGVPDVWVLDLTRQEEGHFSGSFTEARKLFFEDEMPATGNPLVVYSNGYPGVFTYIQEISVVADGRWLPTVRMNLWREEAL
jgi:hypothetical protein